MTTLSTRLNDRLGHYIRLVRADKPIGALLLLWPMLWALWFVSTGRPDGAVLVVFLIGTFLMRSAGCAINDYADREIDGSVKRTRTRPIVTGDVSPREALLVQSFGPLPTTPSMPWSIVMMIYSSASNPPQSV